MAKLHLRCVHEVRVLLLSLVVLVVHLLIQMVHLVLFGLEHGVGCVHEGWIWLECLSVVGVGVGLVLVLHLWCSILHVAILLLENLLL